MTIVKNDFSTLRNFRGKSSLATYLTVVARRVVVRELLSRMTTARLGEGSLAHAAQDIPDPHDSLVEERLGNQEEVERLLGGLQGAEAQVVRLYHLDGKSYHEISLAVGMSENSIGPILSPRTTKCAGPPTTPPCAEKVARCATTQ